MEVECECHVCKFASDFEKDSLPSSFYIPVLSCILGTIAKSNRRVPPCKQIVTPFNSKRIPTVSLRFYLTRIARYSSCSPQVLINALVYIDRIIKQNQGFFITEYNIHRLILTSVLVAAKFFDDHFYNNKIYSDIGGVSASEMNGLEKNFLALVHWDLYVSPEEHKRYETEIVTHASSQAEGCTCYSDTSKVLRDNGIKEYFPKWSPSRVCRKSDKCNNEDEIDVNMDSTSDVGDSESESINRSDSFSSMDEDFTMFEPPLREEACCC